MLMKSVGPTLDLSQVVLSKLAILWPKAVVVLRKQGIKTASVIQSPHRFRLSFHEIQITEKNANSFKCFDRQVDTNDACLIGDGSLSDFLA
jgi:hypothetical protein